MPSSARKLLVALALSACTLRCLGAAESVNDLVGKSLEELAEYKVDAPTRTSLRLAETPGAVSVFTYDQIRANSAQTIPDLLRLVPGLNVRWTPMVESIDARSFGSTPFSGNMLLMIDGVPYNSWDKGGFPDHPGFDFFNLQNVKHIEVIRGGASALYGENAFNGVLNIVTLSGEELETTRLTAEVGNLATRGASFLHGQRFGDEGSVLLSARRMHGDLPDDLWTQYAKGGTYGDDFYVKGKYAGLQLSFYQRSDNTAGFNRPFPDGGFPPGTKFASAAHISQRIDIWAAQYEHAAADDRWSFKVNASHQSRYGTNCSSCHSAAGNPAAGRPESDGYENYFNAQLGLQIIAHNEILLGTEVRKLSAGGDPTESSGTGSTPPPPDVSVVSSYRKDAAYVQDRVTLLDNRASLIAGLRYDSDTRPSEFGSHTFPRLAAVYTPVERLTLRANWGKAARYPTFTEQYAATGFLAAQTPFAVIPLASFVPNYRLRPEFSTETDAGLEYHVSSSLQAKVDLYRKTLHDYIVMVYPGGTFAGISFANHPNDAEVHGLEAELRATFGSQWSAFLNYALQRQTQTGQGVDPSGRAIEFTYAPHNKVNAGVTYSPEPALRATFDLSWKDKYLAPAFWYTIAFPANPVQRYLPGYAYANAQLSYSVPWVGGQGRRPLTLSFKGRNLLNERVYETLSGLGGETAGRTLYLEAQYDFAH